MTKSQEKVLEYIVDAQYEAERVQRELAAAIDWLKDNNMPVACSLLKIAGIHSNLQGVACNEARKQTLRIA